MKYESHITQSACNAKSIYHVLSNLKSFERVRNMIPQDKIQELEIEEDYVRIKVNGLGQKIGVFIADKEEEKVVKYGVENSPIAVTMWIQMKQVALQDTRIKVTLDAEIPFMFRMMVEKKLQDGLNQAADMLAQFPYEEWEKGETV